MAYPTLTAVRVRINGSLLNRDRGLTNVRTATKVEVAPAGHWAPRYRESTQNLRTTFKKIIKRAGLKPWPKPSQNLLSTRETELEKSFPFRRSLPGSGTAS